ncbi:hypothetical protein G6Y98_02750 [Clostridium perfringens]|uniref:hypothetical protein n=1 Tax=Clostridium perfringens TaxID=1502 RepID=UPI0013E38DF5|nr:hypothetical protein [Clostridium perfringens]NGT54766.1 hypothetical protein [Clostridium perfringens]NGT94734.1 hypothetical protein [Clostridium perfringens]
MLLTIKELQMLDLLLKKSGNIINRNNSNDKELNLNLIISYNSSLWSGDFINLNGSYIEEKYIDSDNWIETKCLNSSDLIKLIPEFKFSRYKYIEEDSLHLLLHPLIYHIKKADLTDFKLKPFFYNAVNIENGLKIPFIALDYDKKYEVVSIKSTKD